MSELALKLIAENKAKHARGEDARVLNLANCGLTKLPKTVGELIWLEEILLSNNNGLKDIASMAKLQNLVELDISHTAISDLSIVKFMTKLKKIKASHTKISDLTSLSECYDVIMIDVSYTKVTSLEPIVPLLKKGLQVHLDGRIEIENTIELGAFGD